MERLKRRTQLARLSAAVIAAIAWTGLATQLLASIELAGSVPSAVWAMLRYFTILTNLAVAFVMSAAALDLKRIATPLMLGGVTASIILVGIVYALLLSGLLELSGGAAAADLINHRVTPLLMALYWLIVVPKRSLPAAAPLIWIVPPLAYFPYAMVRGMAEGFYAYPFLNIDSIGWTGVTFYAVAMAAGMLLLGAAMLAIDRKAPRAR